MFASYRAWRGEHGVDAVFDALAALAAATAAVVRELYPCWYHPVLSYQKQPVKFYAPGKLDVALMRKRGIADPEAPLLVKHIAEMEKMRFRFSPPAARPRA